MPQDPFPDPGPDGEERASSPLPPAAGSARWTETTPATWPPPRPATPAPAGASPPSTPTAPPAPTPASRSAPPARPRIPGTPPLSLTTPLTPVARGPCDHAHAEIGYHPSRTLQHLIRARSATCTAPGAAPAARCDLDHTHPWDVEGRPHLRM